MTDDLRAALDDLATEVHAPPLDLAALRRAVHARRRGRWLGAAAGALTLALVAPAAWWAAAPSDRVISQPAAPTDGGGLVQGRFDVRYDAAYDEEAARRGLADCTRLPGLRYVSSRESLPPVDLLSFTGSQRQLAAASRCLEQVPAASVAFTAGDGPPVTLRLSQRGTSRLQVEIGELRASADGWLEHTLLVTNRTDGPVYVDELRIAEQHAGGALSVRSQVCGMPAAPGEAESGNGNCRSRYSPVTIEAGQTWTTLLSVDRGGPDAPALEEGEYTVSAGVSMRTTAPFTAGDRDADDVVRFDLTYAVLDADDPVPAPPPGPPPQDAQTVDVFFSVLGSTDPQYYCNEVAAVPRQVPTTEAVATAALEQLFRGPTEQEQRRYGVGSVFSASTADLLRSVRIEEGIAYVDLRDFRTYPDPRHALGGSSTSCGGAAFDAQVITTLTQFPTVREVRFAFDGDPRAYAEYMQLGCEEPVEAGDPCDPEPFR